MNAKYDYLKTICNLPYDYFDKVNFVIVDTMKKIDITDYTDIKEAIEEYDKLRGNIFYGMFIPPGNKDRLTILINSMILNSKQFNITTTHELFHCCFYIKNNSLLKHNNELIGYKVIDEFYARYNGYVVGFNNALFDDIIFSEDNNVKLENEVNIRINNKKNYYEFISLFATLFFAEKIRNLKIDYCRAFSCFSACYINKIYSILENIDFDCVSLQNLKDMNDVIVKMFDF